LESVISHPSFKLHTVIARYVTYIYDELGPIKGVCYGQIGTYVRVHVLIITNYVKYIKLITQLILYNSIMLK